MFGIFAWKKDFNNEYIFIEGNSFRLGKPE